MKSRERVKNAYEFKAVDRTPLDMTFTISAYNNTVRHINKGFKEATSCNVWQLTSPAKEFLEYMGADFFYLPLKAPSAQPPFILGCDEYTTEFGLIWRKNVMSAGYIDYEPVNAPYKDFSLADLKNLRLPDPDDEAIYAGLGEQAEDLYFNSGLAIVGNFGGSTFTQASMLRGIEQWFVDLLLDPEFAEELMRKLCGYYKALYCNALEICGKYLTCLRTDNDDYGDQNGLMISRDTFGKVIKPHVADYYSTIKKKFHEYNPDGKLLKHSCGDVYGLIDDFIEIGIDVLNPVQPRTRGMTAEKLIPAFGGKIAFHGAIDTQYLLPQGTPEEVKQAVKKAISDFTLPGGGGYVVAPAHHFQPDVPAENIIAMSEAVKETGG